MNLTFILPLPWHLLLSEAEKQDRIQESISNLKYSILFLSAPEKDL